MSDQSQHIFECLKATVLRSADAGAGAWFSEKVGTLSAGYDRDVFLAAYAGAGRRLRAFAVDTDSEDQAVAQSLGAISFPRWQLDRFARCALLHTVLAATKDDEHATIVAEVFRVGDNAEREALLAGLALLPDPGRFLVTAVEACRSNVETVFSAIACENAYASVYFSDESFNQMVMKTVFIGLPLERVAGLTERVNDELVRMSKNYASERRAAGRPVPQDLGLIDSSLGTP